MAASEQKSVLITGASSGFGLLTTVTLAKRGWRVLATMRDLERRGKLEEAAKAAGVLDRIEFHALDVTNPAQIADLATLVAAGPSPLHALINNAGFAMAGFAEDISDQELRQQFETNFFGAAAVTRAFLPQFRLQGMGRIVMLSSVSGRVGFPGLGSYCAAKFALEGWSETLRFELKPLGIHVVLVEPGAFETDIWTRNAQIGSGLAAAQADASSPRAAAISAWRKRIDSGKKRPDPQIVADLIHAILSHPNPRRRYSIGTDAWTALCMKALLPSGMFENLIIKASGLAK